MSGAREFGRRADGAPEQEDEPIPFSIVGYARHDIVDEEDETKVLFAKEAELSFEFLARGSVPFGSMMDIAARVGEADTVQAAYFIRLVHNCLLDDSERRRWSAVLDRQDVTFTTAMFADIVDFLYEEWTGRPFRSRSARRSGPSRTAPGSRAGSRSRASAASRT